MGRISRQLTAVLWLLVGTSIAHSSLDLVPLKSIVVVNRIWPGFSYCFQSEETSKLQDLMGTHISDF